MAVRGFFGRFLRASDRTLKRAPKAMLAALGFSGLCAAAVLSDHSGEVRVSIFYLLAICFISWYGGRWPGALASCLAAFGWFAAAAVRGPLTDAAGSVLNAFAYLFLYLLVSRLVSFLRSRLEEERLAARTDLLTGLPNRLAFVEFAERELVRCRRYRHSVAVMMIDCDDLKAINDQRGHHAGDEAIRAVAQAIRSSIRRSDFAARFGGDEFCVILVEATEASAQTVAPRVIANLESAGKELSLPFALTASVGVVVYPVVPESVDDFLKEADALLDAAKSRGKSKVHIAVIGDLKTENPSA